MGYPMTYQRVVRRNSFQGGYEHSMYAGDLRRLEADQVDAFHVRLYARLAGVTEEQAKMILEAFFASDVYKVATKEEWQRADEDQFRAHS